MKQIKKKNTVLVLGLIALSNFAHASEHGVGNGGRVYVCYSENNQPQNPKTVKSVELVDYIEARSLSDINIDLGMVNPTRDQTYEMIDVALHRLSRLSPQFAIKVKQKINEISAGIQFVDLEKDQVTLSKISDANILISPGSNCIEVQAAFNKSNPSAFEHKYVFNLQVYKLLNSVNRAGLLLHEAIYNIDAEAGAKNSDATRRLIALISSPVFDTLSPAAYDRYIRAALKFTPEVKAENGIFKLVDQWDNDGRNVEEGELVNSIDSTSKVYQLGVLYDFPTHSPRPAQGIHALKYKKVGDTSYLVWDYALPKLNFEIDSRSGSFAVDRGKRYKFKGLSENCSVIAQGENGSATVLRFLNVSDSFPVGCNLTLTDSKNNEVKVIFYGHSIASFGKYEWITNVDKIIKSFNVYLDADGNFTHSEVVKYQYDYHLEKAVRRN